jgi:hypothetical protein
MRHRSRPVGRVAVVGPYTPPSGGGGSEIPADSLSLVDVQAAVDLAEAGDTVVMPSGSANWAGKLSWTAPANVTLRGAGIGSTVITDNYTSNDPLIDITTNATGTFRLSGFTVRGGTGGLKDGGVLKFTGDSHSFRMDAFRLDMQSYSSPHNGKGLWFVGNIYGVIDSCTFDLNSIGNGIVIWNGAGSNGDTSWATATNPSGADFLFIEDCTVNGNSRYTCVNDTRNGGRAVFRYNTIDTGGVQTHSTGSAGRNRGSRHVQVYGNNYIYTESDTQFNCVYLSSGTGYFWGNTVASGGYTHFITIHNDRNNTGTYTQTATPNGWGYSGTDLGPSNWDQNSDSHGYRVLDQPGSGPGDLIVNDFPSAVNQTTGTIAWPNQALEPVYLWSNTLNGTNYVSNYAAGGSIAENRDYYKENASFTGATGIGVGLLSARPSSGLTAGVGYWATDEQKLYVATNSTTWALYYQPYTYPHPLVT